MLSYFSSEGKKCAWLSSLIDTSEETVTETVEKIETEKAKPRPNSRQKKESQTE